MRTQNQRLAHLSGAFLVAVLAAGPAAAQVPDRFSNLEVLPDDIGKQELIQVMRGFSTALGVRCQHCHVGEKVDTLEDFDFAADDKPGKQATREMMKMVAEINGRVAAAVDQQSPLEVGCYTCHRGRQRPQRLREEILAAIASGGVEAGEARYRELREEHFGSAAYDFTGQALNSVAENLYRENQDLEGTIAIIRLNLEFNPEDTYSFLLLAQAQVRQGDSKAAIETLEKALEIEPESRFLQNSLEQLRAAEDGS